MFSLKFFIALALIFRLLIQSELIFVCSMKESPPSFLCMWIHSFPAPFLQQTIQDPLNGLRTLVNNQLTLDVWGFFLTLHSVSLICTLRPLPHCLEHCRLLVGFAIKNCEFFLFLFYFSYSRFLAFFHMNLRFSLSISAKEQLLGGTLVGTDLSLQVSVGSVAMLAILNLLIQAQECLSIYFGLFNFCVL